MAYSIPQMPLVVHVWSDGFSPPAPPRVISPAQLRGIGHPEAVLVGTPPSTSFAMLLCVPEGTDLRDSTSVSGKDLVECPAGSGRLYRVHFVDDMAKGFANEWRFAIIGKLASWPTPIP